MSRISQNIFYKAVIIRYQKINNVIGFGIIRALKQGNIEYIFQTTKHVELNIALSYLSCSIVWNGKPHQEFYCLQTLLNCTIFQRSWLSKIKRITSSVVDL